MNVLKDRYEKEIGPITEDMTNGDHFRTGFHIPPFNTVFHLHLHLIALPLNLGLLTSDEMYGEHMAKVDELVKFLEKQ